MADPKRVRAGKTSRRKGKVFERLIANKLRERFADQEWVGRVRRSDQTHRAHLSDVTGWPHMWVECESAVGSNPTRKLLQAEGDMLAKLGEGYDADIPVAVCREKGSPVITATLRLSKLVLLMHGNTGQGPEVNDPPVTMLFDEFMELYAEWRC